MASVGAGNAVAEARRRASNKGRVAASKKTTEKALSNRGMEHKLLSLGASLQQCYYAEPIVARFCDHLVGRDKVEQKFVAFYLKVVSESGRAHLLTPVLISLYAYARSLPATAEHDG